MPLLLCKGGAGSKCTRPSRQEQLLLPNPVCESLVYPLYFKKLALPGAVSNSILSLTGTGGGSRLLPTGVVDKNMLLPPGPAPIWEES